MSWRGHITEIFTFHVKFRESYRVLPEAEVAVAEPTKVLQAFLFCPPPYFRHVWHLICVSRCATLIPLIRWGFITEGLPALPVLHKLFFNWEQTKFYVT